eukprot:1157013-Pelagomonas_calceolata.AAC.7
MATCQHALALADGTAAAAAATARQGAARSTTAINFGHLQATARATHKCHEEGCKEVCNCKGLTLGLYLNNMHGEPLVGAIYNGLQPKISLVFVDGSKGTDAITVRSCRQVY